MGLTLAGKPPVKKDNINELKQNVAKNTINIELNKKETEENYSNTQLNEDHITENRETDEELEQSVNINEKNITDIKKNHKYIINAIIKTSPIIMIGGLFLSYGFIYFVDLINKSNV